MRTYITIAVAAVFVIGAGVIVVRSGQDASPTTSAPHETINPSAGGSPATGSTAPGKAYTMADVAAHATRTSCWTAIDGGVYDVTPWIDQHPGGAQAILSLCGSDGSSAFDAQHGGQRRPANELAGFKIGSLAGASGASGSTGAAASVSASSGDDSDE